MEHDDSEHDRTPPQPQPPALSVNIDQRGQSVDRQTNAGRDVRSEGENDPDVRPSRRRTPRVYEDELVAAIHDLRQQITGLHGALHELRTNNAALQTEVALLNYKVSHLTERLRQSGPPWGPAQWFVLALVLTVAASVALYIGLVEH